MKSRRTFHFESNTIQCLIFFHFSYKQGMHLEAIKDYEKAEYVYSKALVKHPQNLTILHRVVALKLSRGDVSGALQELNEHLKVHMTDIAAWEQAASLYLQLGQVPQAIFCLEEVVMHQPGNLNALLLLADSLYSLGGEKNVLTAQKVYSGIIEVTNGNHVRALYGLCLCASQLSTASSSSSGLKKAGKSAVKNPPSVLGTLAANALLQQYAALKNSPRKKAPLVKAMLISQNLLSAPDTR